MQCVSGVLGPEIIMHGSETSALVAKGKEREFMLDIPPSFTYHTPPVPQDSDVA